MTPGLFRTPREALLTLSVWGGLGCLSWAIVLGLIALVWRVIEALTGRS